jgi:hypothetical protein
MLHGLHLATPFTIGIRSFTGFEDFVVGSYFSVDNLKGSFTGFGCKRCESKEVIGVVECALIWLYGFAISDSGMICWGYFDRFIPNFTTFQVISSFEVCVDVYYADKISVRNVIFVSEWFLKEVLRKDFALMLLSRIWEKKVYCQMRLIC